MDNLFRCIRLGFKKRSWTLVIDSFYRLLLRVWLKVDSIAMFDRYLLLSFSSDFVFGPQRCTLRPIESGKSERTQVPVSHRQKADGNH